MDMLFLNFGTVLVLCQLIMADKTGETYEKFYTADSNYVPTPGGERRHGAMGISTVAKFSMLSNTPTLFKVKRPGLYNDANTVSFESIHKPGYYLRYKNYKFHMEKQQETNLFDKDATFRERQGPRGRAYELLGRSNWFICHSEESPYTLKAISEKIGTKAFVDNCVYVPVRQQFVERKNIVRTIQSGGSMVVNAVPSTQTTDKCISLRFINKLGGPVRVVSSMKPEGYLVTANAFKLKTIFKHANHKQRHVIFYAENVQDRDDDVLLNAKNVFTVKPKDCVNDFQDVILMSPTEETGIESEGSEMTSATNQLTNPDEIPKATTAAAVKLPSTSARQPPSTNDNTPKPPAITGDIPKPPGDKPVKPASKLGISSSLLDNNTGKPQATNWAITANEIGVNNQPTTPNDEFRQPSDDKTSVSKAAPAPATASKLGITNSLLDNNMGKPQATNSAITGNEIGVNNQPTTPNDEFRLPSDDKTSVSKAASAPAAATLNKPIHSTVSPNTYSSLNMFHRQDNVGYQTPLKQQINTLDDVLEKRIHASPVGVSFSGSPLSASGGDLTNGYETWSSYGPCSVSCGVGYRRRTRLCRPGLYCNGPSAETRACIKEQCATNCVHTTGGSARPGSCCYFPFTFNGAQYDHCILSPRSNDRLWCSTTPYFDEHKQWGYCPQSVKAPVRSLPKPSKPKQMLQAPQPYVVTNPVVSQYSTYYSRGAYNNPYRAYKDSSIPCNTMCYLNCAPICPRNCCLSTRNDMPLTAYLGENYGPTDKRSFITPYQARYRRNTLLNTRKLSPRK